MRIEKQLWFWLAALALVVLAIALLKDILLPFVAAIVIAYFLNPLADRLQARGLAAHLGGDHHRRPGRGGDRHWRSFCWCRCSPSRCAS